METEIWQPVVDGKINIDWAVGVITEIEIAGNEFTTTGNDGIVYMKLPDNLRLCERVEPEAFTEDALRREGWIQTITINQHEQYTLRLIDSERIHVARWGNGEWYVITGDIFGEGTEFPGVTTMADLRALVRMLGGAA